VTQLRSAAALGPAAEAADARGTASPWYVVPEPRPAAAVRLLCFPYAGGGAGAFTSWLPHLPGSVELVAVQLPGRGGRSGEAPWTSLEALAAGVAAGIAPLLDRPVAFFGHSMGALLAFEVARCGRLPAALYVSAFSAPQLLVAERTLWRLTDSELRQRLVELGGVPAELVGDERLIEMALPVLRADISACDSYIYTDGEPLGCPIVGCGGLQDRVVTGPELAAWEAQTRAGFTLRMFPGGHFYWSSDGALPLLLWTVTRHLADVGRDSGGAVLSSG
jgi:medium-chain acyl-[acyl-carrier-protein] hydrolase